MLTSAKTHPPCISERILADNFYKQQVYTCTYRRVPIPPQVYEYFCLLLGKPLPPLLTLLSEIVNSVFYSSDAIYADMNPNATDHLTSFCSMFRKKWQTD